MIDAASASVLRLASGSTVEGFVQATSLNILAELGDKTFCIAAILSMKHSRLAVFIGCMLAMAIMTVLSTMLGSAAHVLPKVLVDGLSSALFFYFGGTMLWSYFSGDDDDSDDELAEAEAELKDGGSGEQKSRAAKFVADALRVLGPVAAQACSMVLLAEWGDRSQVATIGLAASRGPVAVATGAIAGQAVAMGVAVVGGRGIASRISERTMSLFGGVLFLVFGTLSAAETVEAYRAGR
ncbi:unnamed protein product [Pedinophyceae sp. YPF-701]|nr:unnamed protein product [Pedinophyceae sp. YPF-701]